MTRYNVYYITSGKSLGTFTAASPSHAVAAMLRSQGFPARCIVYKTGPRIVTTRGLLPVDPSKFGASELPNLAVDSRSKV